MNKFVTSDNKGKTLVGQEAKIVRVYSTSDFWQGVSEFIEGTVTFDWGWADMEWNALNGRATKMLFHNINTMIAPTITMSELDLVPVRQDEYSKPKCVCGSESVGGSGHSYWCEKYEK